jgi:DNA-binding XRE family transcriptional regulator
MATATRDLLLWGGGRMTVPEELVAFGRALARVRKKAGYSQARLGETIGVPRSTIGDWEKGAYEPLPRYVFAIEAACDAVGELSRRLGYASMDLPQIALAVGEKVRVVVVDKAAKEIVVEDARGKRWRMELLKSDPALGGGEFLTRTVEQLEKPEGPAAT